MWETSRRRLENAIESIVRIRKYLVIFGLEFVLSKYQSSEKKKNLETTSQNLKNKQKYLCWKKFNDMSDVLTAGKIN